MAVSYLSSFLSTLLPSKLSCPQRQTCLHFLPTQLNLRDISSGLCSATASLSSLYASDSDISPIVYPELAYSTTLYFKSTYNFQIIPRDNEPEERLLNRFRKEVMKAGLIQECKRRRFFETNREKRKRKTREAARKNRKRRPQPRAPAKDKREAPKKKKDDEEDDNWEIPDVDLPYC